MKPVVIPAQAEIQPPENSPDPGLRGDDGKDEASTWLSFPQAGDMKRSFGCHSREGGNPVAHFWIPAVAGMTTYRVFVC
jgi:hypothetical protein